MKSERLLAMLLLLRAHGRLPATDLAARLDVSVRTVFRDVRYLAAVGVPVHTERGRHGGIALRPDYRTDIAGMSDDEARALFVLLTERTNAEPGFGDALGSAMRKVMAALPGPQSQAADLVSGRIMIDPVCWPREQVPTDELGVLQAAVLGDRRVRMRYRHGDETVRGYVLDPYGLVGKSGIWYLVADRDGEPRLFNVDRIAEVAVVDESVRRRPGVTLDDLWRRLRREIDEVPVEIRVRAGILQQFLHRHHADLAAPPPESGFPAADDAPDWVRVRLLFRSVCAARRLLDFGTDVEVLSPPELRRDLAHTAARVAALYTRE